MDIFAYWWKNSRHTVHILVCTIQIHMCICHLSSLTQQVMSSVQIWHYILYITCTMFYNVFTFLLFHIIKHTTAFHMSETCNAKWAWRLSGPANFTKMQINTKNKCKLLCLNMSDEIKGMSGRLKEENQGVCVLRVLCTVSVGSGHSPICKDANTLLTWPILSWPGPIWLLLFRDRYKRLN